MKKFERFVKDESGATAIEYGLIAAAIGLMLVVALPTLKDQLKSTFSAVEGGLNDFNSQQ